MTIIESLKEYFQGFPPLAGKRIGIDCLSAKEYSYSIDSVPCESIVSRYLDGTTVRRCLFTISSRMFYGNDIAQQAENIEFFEQLEMWLSEQETFFRLPKLGAKRRARSLTVLCSAYPTIANEDEGTARYQIQCQLIYTQEV